jgi:hypothetical protein
MHTMLPHFVMYLTLLHAPEPPVAIVLSIRGEVQLRKAADAKIRKAAARDFLWPGDRLTVPAEGKAVLVFPASGMREQLKPGAEITIEAKGARPPEAVELRTALPASVVDGLRDVRPPPGGSRAGVVVFRSADNHGPSPAVTPIVGALVAGDRPEFAWKKADRVSTYWVRLAVDGSDRELWRLEATTNHLKFPKDQPALKRGRSYVWTVTDPDGGRIVSSRFAVADLDDIRVLEQADALARSGDAADLLAAQLVLESLGAIDRAVVIGEKLTSLAPRELSHLESLADLYSRAGRVDEAVSALESLADLYSRAGRLDEAALARSRAERLRKPR